MVKMELKLAPDQRNLERFHFSWPVSSDSISLERFRLPLPLWSKTGRRSYRTGKEKNSVPVSANHNLPPKKRKMDVSSNQNPVNPGKNPSVIFNDGINDPETPVRTGKYHVCDVCDRCFKSYQALGGHKAHHNNMRARKILNSTGGEDDEEYSGSSIGCHRCPFCDKTFSKGQALGGHKRHCRRLQTRVLSFDLNQLPTEWTADDRV